MIALQNLHQLSSARLLSLLCSYLIKERIRNDLLDINTILGVELGDLTEQIHGSWVNSLHITIATSANLSNLSPNCSSNFSMVSNSICK